MKLKIINRITLYSLISMLIGIMLISSCAQSPTSAPTTTTETSKPDIITLKFAETDAANFSRPTYAMIPTLDEMEKLSNGRIVVQRFWGGTLVSAANCEPAITSGLIDFGAPRQYEGGPYLLCALGGLPYAAEKDGNSVTRAVNKLVAKGYMDAALQRANLKYLTHLGSTGYHIGFKNAKPMTFKDLAGIKIRDPGGYMGKALKAMGMSPTTLIPAEAYDGLSKGVVDAIFWHMPGHIDVGTWELYKSFLLLNLGRFTTKFMAFSQKRWDTLPPDIQKLISDLWGEKYMERELESYVISGKLAEDKMRGKGIDFYSLPEAEMEKVRKSVIPVWDQAIAEMDKLGLNGRQVMTEYTGFLKEFGEKPPWAP